MANTYLTRTPSSTGNRKILTISCWFKRSNVSSTQTLFANGGNSYNRDYISFESNQLVVARYDNAYIYQIKTNRVFRDINSWYHLMVAFDTTEDSSDNRIKIYINGVRETSFATNTRPALNVDTWYNYAGYLQNIGVDYDNAGNDFNGSMSYVALVDGKAELPTIFGETDSATGQWKINTSITPSSGWGTNGFLILKNGNSLTDESTNSNNYTLGGGTLTDTKDCPSNVFAVWNTLSTVSYKQANTLTLSNGNTTILESGGNYKNAPSTVGAFTGKYYSEHKMGTLNNSLQYSNYVGVITSGDVQRIGDTYNHVGQTANSVAYNSYNGQVFVSNSGSSYGAALANGDILGIALDVTNLKVYFSKNGVWQNSGNPESGATGTGAVSLPSTEDSWLFGGSPANSSIQSNFGNGFFGTSAVADNSTTTASTPGTFNYDVPTGYQPLSTKGLNA